MTTPMPTLGLNSPVGFPSTPLNSTTRGSAKALGVVGELDLGVPVTMDEADTATMATEMCPTPIGKRTTTMKWKALPKP